VLFLVPCKGACYLSLLVGSDNLTFDSSVGSSSVLLVGSLGSSSGGSWDGSYVGWFVGGVIRCRRVRRGCRRMVCWACRQMKRHWRNVRQAARFLWWTGHCVSRNAVSGVRLLFFEDDTSGKRSAPPTYLTYFTLESKLHAKRFLPSLVVVALT
jgi:hypothetical protein